MKPFDLEAAKRGESLVTRDGREAEFLAYSDKLTDDTRLLVRVGNAARTYYDTGRRYSGKEHFLDLFLAPKKHTVWVNLYQDEVAYYYDTEKAANENADTCRIGGRAYPLEIEE